MNTIYLMFSNSFPNGVITQGEEINGHAKRQLTQKAEQAESSVIVINGMKYVVWGRIDLTRMGTFKLNGHIIYSLSQHMKVPSEEDIIKEILAATGNEWAETMLYVKLLQQDALGVAHTALFTKFKLIDTKIFKVMQIVYSLEIEGKTFKVVQEIFCKLINRKATEDPFFTEETLLPKDISYFKIKTVTGGSRDSLKFEDFDEIKTKVMHTADFKKEEEAKNANYASFWDKSSADTRSEFGEKKS